MGYACRSQYSKLQSVGFDTLLAPMALCVVNTGCLIRMAKHTDTFSARLRRSFSKSKTSMPLPDSPVQVNRIAKTIFGDLSTCPIPSTLTWIQS